jgi:hypothetical protein
MTDDQDQELEDDEPCRYCGEQHEPDECDDTEEYEATFTFTVTGSFRARSEDEANELAEALLSEMDLTGPEASGDDQWDDIDYNDPREFYVITARESFADHVAFRAAKDAAYQALIAAES